MYPATDFSEAYNILFSLNKDKKSELLQEYGKITVHEEDVAKLKAKKAIKTVRRTKI